MPPNRKKARLLENPELIDIGSNGMLGKPISKSPAVHADLATCRRNRLAGGWWDATACTIKESRPKKLHASTVSTCICTATRWLSAGTASAKTFACRQACCAQRADRFNCSLLRSCCTQRCCSLQLSFVTHEMHSECDRFNFMYSLLLLHSDSVRFDSSLSFMHALRICSLRV